MATKSLPWRALLLAPLATIPVVVISGLGSSDAGLSSDFAWGLYFAVTIGLPFAYAGMALVGLPTFLVLRRFGYVHSWLFGLVGVGVPLALFAGEANPRMLATVGLSGFFVALVAFILAKCPEREREV
jgi:hypothetical protein